MSLQNDHYLMKKEFLLNIILLVGINLLVKPLYIFGIDAEVQNMSTTQEWEIYISFLNLCYIFQMFNDVGIHSFNLQYIAKKREDTTHYVSNILGLKGVLAIVYFVSITISFMVLGYDWKMFSFFIWIGINQVLTSLMSYLRSNVSGNGLYRWDSILSILDRLLLLFIMGYILYFSAYANDFDIMYFVYAQTVSLCISLTLAYMVLSKVLTTHRIRFSIQFAKELLPKTIPFALIFLLMTAYSRIDIIMLEQIVQDNGYQIGAYSACYRLMEASNMFAYLFAALLLPMIAHIIHKREDVMPIMSLGLRTILIFSLVISFSLICYRDDILPLFYDRADALFGEVLIYLMCSFICVAVAYVFGSSVVATGKVRSLNMLFGGCLVLNLIMNLIMIPKYGAVGAAIATLITQGLSTIGQVYLSNKLLKLKWQMKDILSIVGFAILSFAILYFSTFIPSIQWWISLAIGIITCIIVALLLRMISLEELLSIAQSRIKP